MSLKALQRRAREARTWLGGPCMTLWSREGLAPGGDAFLEALQLNHRAGEEAKEGSASAQSAMRDLFALAPRVGFDSERASELVALATARLEALGTEAAPRKARPGARTMAACCEDLRTRLLSFASAQGEDVILTSRAACRSFDTLMDDFLTPEGGWVAAYTAEGLPAVIDMPAREAGPLTGAMSPLLALIEA